MPPAELLETVLLVSVSVPLLEMPPPPPLRTDGGVESDGAVGDCQIALLEMPPPKSPKPLPRATVSPSSVTVCCADMTREDPPAVVAADGQLTRPRSIDCQALVRPTRPRSA